MTAEPSFASFWAGPSPSSYERACLASFARLGYAVTLYSYERYDGLPEGIRCDDAAKITPKRDLGLFLYRGKPDLSHFSDYFRYRLFQETEHIWIDADVLLLRPFDDPLPPMLLAKEHATSICGAVMRLDRTQVDLGVLVERTRNLAGKPLRWGESGPVFLTSLYVDSPMFRNAYEPKFFYPILYDVFWKVLLPEERDACEAACREAFTLHLWNNIVVQLGVWKSLAPPAGSYLHARFAEMGQLGAFAGTYPAEVMRQMVENWRLRMSGGDAGVGNLVRQLVPGAIRTARRKGWLRPASDRADGKDGGTFTDG
jgi:hypothetical protein